MKEGCSDKEQPFYHMEVLEDNFTYENSKFTTLDTGLLQSLFGKSAAFDGGECYGQYVLALYLYQGRR